MRCDLEDAPHATTFESDVCIIGAGIAGLILARKMAARGKVVHLLEAGGVEEEPRSQELYRGEMMGTFHRGTTEGRFRTFGGSSTHWAAQLLPYPDEVFEARQAVDRVGWPISGADLAGYYPEIHEIMGANAFRFDDRFLSQIGAQPYPGDDAVRVRFSKWAPFSRRNLARTVGKDCLASDKVTVFFHANAVSINFSPSGAEVTGVSVKNYRDGSFTFKARLYVISTGTIETSRLLLNSTRLSPSGAGNPGDRVGRYFFDHVSCTTGKISSKAFPVYKKYFAPYYRQKTLHTARFETSAALQEKLAILAVMAHFEFEEAEGSGLVIFRRFLHDIQAGRVGRKGGQEISSLPKAALGGLRTVYDLKVRGRRIPSPEARITLRFDVEQKPSAESRILLSDQLDSLGQPRLAVDWKRSEDEAHSMHAFAGHMDAFLKSVGLELEWREGLRESAGAWRELGIDCFHPMGGARMGLSPATSVVDARMRVHGVANLFVASCAVYPSGGSSNPTFSLMALTLRLADHLMTV
jgi:choline dehydrogenase-like flavoprotein